MKKGLLALLAILTINTMSWAQSNDKTPPVKKISVTGSAESEITPDIIYFDITLHEYKNRNSKVDISTLEKQLQKAALDAGVRSSDFTIANVYGFNGDQWWKKKKDPDFMARKTYRLKLSKLDKINDILAAVDDEGIESVSISSYEYSKMESLRKEVKEKAIQAAKTKAAYLAAAIDEQIGGALEIQELNTDNYSDVRPVMYNTMVRAAAAPAADMPSIDFKTIKVRAEVNATFFIK